MDFSSGTWLAARCSAEDRLLSDEELSLYRRGVDNQLPCRLRFGHTSPIYVVVGGQGARIATYVDEARRILNGFEQWAG